MYMDCSPPGSSVYGILQLRILECVAIPFSCTIHRFYTESPGKPHIYILYIFMYMYYYYTENAMAAHSSTLAQKIPWMEEPGRLQSMESLRVGHDRATSLSLFTFMHWRRKWQPTPVFLPGESQGRGSLVGCRLCGRTESDTTDVTQQQEQHYYYK